MNLNEDKVKRKLEKKTITMLELANIINDTTLQAQFAFWQRASDYQKGLLKNLKDKGYNLLQD